MKKKKLVIIPSNTPTPLSRSLFYGDNLDVLRKQIATESVDLCYIDPPFNSKRNYNQIYNSIGDEIDKAQAQAFVDTWVWDDMAQEGLEEIRTNGGNRFPEKLIDLIDGLHKVIHGGSLLAYLIHISLRVVEIHRILKKTGSFYLHCDPTASHYLKLILDSVFLCNGGDFKNEIIWHYRKWSIWQRQFCSNHDVIFFYTKSDSKERYFDQPTMDRAASTLKRFGNAKIVSGHDKLGNRTPSTTLDVDSLGVPMDDVWDIGRVPPIKQLYPTEKPLALLERIVEASSKEGDMVLDAYCGCGTTVAVAEKLKRSWIGIDVTYQSISVILKRLGESFGKDIKKNIVLSGVPQDMKSAVALAHKKEDKLRKEFEKWAALTYSDNHAIIHEKKGADSGIDAVIKFVADTEKERLVGTAIISVKSGGVNSETIRDLRGTLEREKALVGILLTLEEPTEPMNKEAKEAGMYKHFLMGKSFNRIQIVTIKEIIEGNVRFGLPMGVSALKKAKLTEKEKQVELLN
jgi:site-specific DNA-methyltransferase (adenine-specific)